MLEARIRLTLLLVTILMPAADVAAQEYNALAECRSQSLQLDQIHDCMDGYLDILDGNMRAITDFLGESLDGEALQGLDSSQQAFVEFRRQNCLWYLEFSSPRSEAEQIAKNCLADMSKSRLQELQELVTAEDRAIRTMQGYYVFGPERNSFQPCGTSDRFWVEGDSAAVGLLQQNYLSVASDERQLLHTDVVGRLNDQLQAPEGHAGVLLLDTLIELRAPSETDCNLPGQSFNLDISATDIAAADSTREVLDDERVEQEEPEQQLTAYFGDWVVDCIELTGRKSCSLEVALRSDDSDAGTDDNALASKLVVNRSPKKSTYIEVIFPDREIDSPTLIRWQVDQQSLGDIVGSEIRVDELEARLLVSENEYLVDELMPLLIDGDEINFNVLEDVDDTNGDLFTGTLLGLTKALRFADGFVSESG